MNNIEKVQFNINTTTLESDLDTFYVEILGDELTNDSFKKYTYFAENLIGEFKGRLYGISFKKSIKDSDELIDLYQNVSQLIFKIGSENFYNMEIIPQGNELNAAFLKSEYLVNLYVVRSNKN